MRLSFPTGLLLAALAAVAGKTAIAADRVGNFGLIDADGDFTYHNTRES